MRAGGLAPLNLIQPTISLEMPVVTVTVFKYRNKIGKIFVKAVPYSVT
jgi:hypothetical protein